MYNGPPLPPERELPLSLIVEFLMAAGAGRDDQEFLSVGWTDTELEKAEVASRQGIRGFLEDGTAGSNFAGGLFTALTKNETPAILDQLRSAQKTWVAALPTERRQQVKDAVARYGLPETWQARRVVFSEWARRLREKSHKPQLAHHDFSLMGFSDARSPYRLAKGFKKFLDQDALPYFSRDHYMEDEGAKRAILSEAELIRKIDGADETGAILIHGPGGHGKTRLAHQLCKATTADLALRIEPLAADFLKLKEYLERLKDGGREPAALGHVLLFQDYAENVRTATPLRSFCDVVRNDLDVRTTLILCCRSSGVRLVEQTYDDFEIDAYSVGAQKGNGKTYEHWLVAQILKHFDLDHDAGLAALTRDLPFLAAFAGFLKTEHPSLFDKQFRISADNQHFAAWARRRVDSLASLESTARRRVAEIALALPMAKAEVDHITDDRNEVGTKIFEALEGDFWIVEEADTYAPVHDAFADALVTQHLFGTQKPENRMAELLSTACEKEYFGRALHALGRVSEAEEFQAMDPVPVLAKLEKKHTLAIQQNALEVVRSALVPTHRLPSVLNAIDSLYEGLQGDLEACRFLSHSVASIRKRTWTTALAKSPRLDELFKSVSFSSDLRMISNLVWHDPDSYRDRATSLLLKSADDWEASYLIPAVLANGGSLLQVGPAALRWLRRFSTAPAAAFVLSAWFEAKERAEKANAAGTPVTVYSEEVAGFLAPWCLRHGRKYFAARILAAWASESRGSTQAMSALDEWLELFAHRYGATYLLQTALGLGRGLDEKLQDYVKRWLAENSRLHPVETSYLFRDLMRAGASWRPFSSEALAFIESDLPAKSRRDMCGYWLNMGGEPKSIKEALRSAVDQDPLDEHVRFVFQSWAVAAPEEIGFWAPDMVRWLKAHSAHPRASYVFNLWYKHKLDVAAVRPLLIAWLKRNRSDSQYPVLLHKHYSREAVPNPEVFPFAELSLAWLKDHAGHPNSSFILLGWIYREEDFTTILPDLRIWLKQNAEHPSFPGLLARYATVDPAGFGEIGMTEERARAFVNKESFVKGDCVFIEFILSSPFGSNPQSDIGRAAIEAARNYLGTFGSDLVSAFLIAKVVRLIGAEGWIITLAETWLEGFGLRHRANLVLQALLAVSPPASTYETQVKAWLPENQEYKFAGALLLEWARAGGDVMLFQREATAWIDAAHANDDFPDVDEVERLYWQANIQMSRHQVDK